MRIGKNWFYVIDDTFSQIIEIEDWIYASLFIADTSKSFEFILWKNSRLDFFWFFTRSSSELLKFRQEWENSYLKIKQMFFCSSSDLKSSIKSIVNSNNSKSFVDIISIVKDKKVSIDSSIEIEKWCIWVDADLKQKNIFIWDKWEVRWLPKLLVKSFSVKASHSCNVERINDDYLFYLKSRGIDENNAITLMIKSFFVKNFSCLKMLDKKLYDKTYDDFLTLNI